MAALCFVEIDHDDVGALAGEGARDALAETRSGAGNDGDPVLKTHASSLGIQWRRNVAPPVFIVISNPIMPQYGRIAPKGESR
jgi:hypothetical protein